MKNREKYIYNFLSEEERLKLKNSLAAFENEANYHKIDSAQEMIDELLKHIGKPEPKLIQIIAHGNCDGFGISNEEFVKYSEISECLRNINTATENELILNLMTVCCSVHQLSFFNSSEIKLFKNLIGSLKGAPVHGAINHSREVNKLNFSEVRNKIEELNENLEMEYSIEKPETYTYWVL
ncbi:MAG: hypothetical protein K2Y30_03305 [Flavobacteriaceae bacterium]|nr:hypothetical protein [Flavobacteriaceae bacterium]